MAKFRPWWLVVALCFWAGSVFLGCGDADQAPSGAKKIVKGKVPTVQKAVSPEATKPAPPPPVRVESAKEAPAPVSAAAAPGGKAAEPGEPEVNVPAPQGGESSGATESELPEARDDADSTPMEDGLAAAAKLKRLLSLETCFSYKPEKKIDPFKPVFGTDEPKIPLDESGQKTLERKKRIPRSPIEMVDLSQLKLTAVILAPSGNLAMVEDTTGKGYIVKKGTYIGNREGQVTEILPDRLLVTEQGVDDLGKPISEIREIQLPKPPGEM